MAKAGVTFLPTRELNMELPTTMDQPPYTPLQQSALLAEALHSWVTTKPFEQPTPVNKHHNLLGYGHCYKPISPTYSPTGSTHPQGDCGLKLDNQQPGFPKSGKTSQIINATGQTDRIHFTHKTTINNNHHCKQPCSKT